MHHGFDKLLKNIFPQYQQDYIPNGESLGQDKLINVRPANGVYQCNAVVSDDIQSGPIYCGDLATIIASIENKPDHFVAVCKRHERYLRELINDPDKR